MNLRALSALAAVGLAGCATIGSVVPSFERAAPQTGEGFVVLGADSPEFIGGIEFCRDGSPTDCFGTRAFEAPTELEAWRLPVGRYCAVTVSVTRRANGANFDHRPRAQYCFEAIEGALVYPGHLSVMTGGNQELTGRIGIGWRVLEPERVRSEYPLLESMELQVILGTRAR